MSALATRTRLRERLAVTPAQYRRLALAVLLALSLIVLTGAAVRLTGSGLGCPDWPKCFGRAYPPFSSHALIEFGNRMLSGLVGFLCIAAVGFAATRRPYRRDLLWWSLTLPLGVVAQAVLGGFTVREHLAPGFVMGHFGLSMIVLVGAFGLFWRASHEPGTASERRDRTAAWSVWGLLVPLGAVTIFAGTAATAAGPHAGGSPGQRIHRLTFRGTDTLNWVIHRHATLGALTGVAVIAVWYLVRRRGLAAGRTDAALEPVTILGLLLAGQGLVGSVQYELKLPTDMVWVHVGLATVSWVVLLWAATAAGRCTPAGLAGPFGAASGSADERDRRAQRDLTAREGHGERGRQPVAPGLT